MNSQKVNSAIFADTYLPGFGAFFKIFPAKSATAMYGSHLITKRFGIVIVDNDKRLSLFESIIRVYDKIPAS
jgi:hypothetical protein